MKKKEILFSDQTLLLLNKTKNQVDAISDLAERLALAENNAPARTFYTLMIQQTCDDLFKALDNVLFFCNTDHPIKVENHFFDLNKMLNGLFIAYNDFFISEGLKLICNLPSSQPDSFIWTDEKKLKRIFENLLDNALKFTDNGKVEFGYEICEDGHLAFFVSDTGIGIRDEEKEKIFEPFCRSSEAFDRGIEGTGLGLSVVVRLAESLGAKIQLETEYGKGSCFRLMLDQENHKEILS